MTSAHNIALGQGSVRAVSAVSGSLTNRSALFPGLIEHLQSRLPGPKVARQLAEIFQCEERTAFRYMAGERMPGGNEIACLFEHPTMGPVVLAYMAEWIAANLSERDRETFVKEMAKSTLRAIARGEEEEMR